MFSSFSLNESNLSRLDAADHQNLDLVNEFSQRIQDCFIPAEEFAKQIHNIQVASKELQDRLVSLGSSLETLPSSLGEKYASVKHDYEETKQAISDLITDNKESEKQFESQREKYKMLQHKYKAEQESQQLYEKLIDAYKTAANITISNSQILKERN